MCRRRRTRPSKTSSTVSALLALRNHPPPRVQRAGRSISRITARTAPGSRDGRLEMNEEELLATFTRILRDLLFNDAIVLTMETERADVPDWDSFNYINFIVAVELELGIKFNVTDVESFKTVGEIVRRARSMLSPGS